MANFLWVLVAAAVLTSCGYGSSNEAASDDGLVFLPTPIGFSGSLLPVSLASYPSAQTVPSELLAVRIEEREELLVVFEFQQEQTPKARFWYDSAPGQCGHLASTDGSPVILVTFFNTRDRSMISTVSIAGSPITAVQGACSRGGEAFWAIRLTEPRSFRISTGFTVRGLGGGTARRTITVAIHR